MLHEILQLLNPRPKGGYVTHPPATRDAAPEPIEAGEPAAELDAPRDEKDVRKGALR